MRLLRWLFGAGAPAADRAIPERPPDWNLTIADLFAEMEAGKRKSVGPPESDWAREYERSLIPEGGRFPREGDVYAALADRKVKYLTSWAGPYTLGGEATLLKGDRVRVTGSVEAEPLGVYAEADDYDALEARMVPAGERRSRKYTGFYFYFGTRELNEAFELVETAE